MTLEVFIQNEAGSSEKHNFDEKTLAYLGSKPVSRAYPYPYGFILGTTSADGDNLDCFILTDRPLDRATTVVCEPIGLLEQIEDNLPDHNVLAVPVGERFERLDEAVERLRDFIAHVFDHVPGKQISTGRVLPAEDALRLIEECNDA
jgi:inorganic pyrophosphatase